jgi:uncharacterized membrane-anchored protein
MLLELAPRDPRSILQGDYMVLRYSLARQINRKEVSEDGYVVVKLDQNNVASFVRKQQDDEKLQPNEHLLQYRIRNGVAKIATDAYFFQEQHGQYYRSARYGEVRVSDNGNAVLVGLRDAKFQVMKPVEEENTVQ